MCNSNRMGVLVVYAAQILICVKPVVVPCHLVRATTENRQTAMELCIQFECYAKRVEFVVVM